MKLFDIFSTASDNMLRNKARSFLTILAIFIGALTLSLTTAIGDGIRSYLGRQLGNLGADTTLAITARPVDAKDKADSDAPDAYDPDRKQNTSQGRNGPSGASFMNNKDLDKLKARGDLTNVKPVIDVSADYIQYGSGTRYQLNPGAGGLLNIDVAAGRAVAKDSTDEVTLPKSYVKALGFSSEQDAVGKTVSVRISDPTGATKLYDLKVVGIQQKSLIGSSSTFVSEKTFNEMYDFQTGPLTAIQKEQYGAFYADFSKDLTQQQQDDLKQSLKDAGYNASTIKDQSKIIFDVVNGIILVLNGFAIIALLAASLGIVNTLLMSVQERTKEIGLMKALGLGRWSIFSLFSIEAILLGFWGSLIGILAAYGIGTVANKISADTFLKNIEGLKLLEFPLMNQVYIALGIMLVAFLAGTIPAQRAAGKDPIEALRYE